MPRKSEADQYTKFLDSQSADLASGNTTVKPKTSGAKRPGRPKKENVSGSSPFLGRVAATGKITKNNLKKNLEASYTANLKEHDDFVHVWKWMHKKNVECINDLNVKISHYRSF